MDKNKKRLLRVLISVVLFAVTVVLELTVNAENYVWFFPYIFIYLACGYDVLFKAVKHLIRGKVLDENFLMTIASIGAFILGEFTEGVAVMLFYQVGELFQGYAVQKSRKSVSELMNIRPDKAVRVGENGIEEVFPEDIEVGEIVLVKSGEKIPLDGKVVKGNSDLDLKALTGESEPVFVKEGDSVLSGSIVLNGNIMVKAEKVFYDSTVSKILDMVENVAGKKAKTENFITAFSKYYTPAVVIGAVLIALIPSLITGDIKTHIISALTFLVVSCPCALVISVPLGFFGGIGGAGYKGVLIKGSEYIEKLSKANVFVFDKTGTLTKGEFSVSGIYPKEKRDEILKYAVICESLSNHPIAKCILNAYEGKIPEGYEVKEIAGKGMTATNSKETVLVGNKLLMEENGVKIDYSEGVTSVYVALNGEYLGVITLQDTVREDAYSLIENLKRRGDKIYMFTGDNKSQAKAVADKLDIENYKYGLLPDMKALELEKIINEKKKGDVCCFVGDGINDAPVLMLSDVGISMGGIGSDSALEASDVVLMFDKLSGITDALKICKKTMRLVLENIIFALAVKFSVLVLSALSIGRENMMWYAVFADVGVAVLAILNSMRALIVKNRKK